ncbi:hypothetical protein GCM10020366_08980 [Saccharopolyspora gregorii]|uniref:DUF397 domain-containing protein n=1 Tax=Saccharopolyspora gregorii TaxID=33914 RepID=A0ABP6RJ32_9PSEU
MAQEFLQRPERPMRRSSSAPGRTAIRDSKLGDHSPMLPFPAQAWTTFLTNLKTGTYDR